MTQFLPQFKQYLSSVHLYNYSSSAENHIGTEILQTSYELQYDETINTYWRDQVRQYTAGEKSRDQAIADFKQQVADNLDVIVE